MNDVFNTQGLMAYLEPPEKFEAGTLNIEGIYGLKAEIEYLNQIGMKNIQNYEKKLCNYAFKKLKKIKVIIVYNESKKINSNIIIFNKKNIFAQDKATYLNSRGIVVRSGQHCAKLLEDVLKLLLLLECRFLFIILKKKLIN